jgi:hypothetical protein
MEAVAMSDLTRLLDASARAWRRVEIAGADGEGRKSPGRDPR